MAIILHGVLYAQNSQKDTVNFEYNSIYKHCPIPIIKSFVVKDHPKQINQYPIGLNTGKGGGLVGFKEIDSDLYVSFRKDWTLLNTDTVFLNNLYIHDFKKIDTLNSIFWIFKVRQSGKHSSPSNIYVYQSKVGIIALKSTYGRYFNSSLFNNKDDLDFLSDYW